MAVDRSLSRRDFVRAGAAGAALLLGNAPPLKAEGAARLPQRVLGKTGVRVPILGLGTVAVGNVGDRKKAVALLNKAIDLGVTYIDTAPPRTRVALVNLTHVLKKYDKAKDFQNEMRATLAPFQRKDAELKAQLDKLDKLLKEQPHPRTRRQLAVGRETRPPRSGLLA